MSNLLTPVRRIASKGKRFIRRVLRLGNQDTSNTSKVEPFHFVAPDQQTLSRLDEIPSEATLGERQFLYQYFSSVWSGDHDVIEIGPFLGGTSRAIALGMLRNPRRRPGTRLRTFDRFQDYYDIPRLIELLKPMTDKGAIDPQAFTSLGDRAAFLEVFHKIHQSQDYEDCLLPSNHGVPDLPEQVASGQWMQLPDGFVTDSVFVDGCKSWYGTKYFMQLMAGVVKPGAVFLFQDYACYTCFWLPAFIGAFRDKFRLMGNVDCTYGFQLLAPISAEEIDATFPNSPDEAGAPRLRQWIQSQIDSAGRRSDHYGAVRHTIHKAGAMAYVGLRDEAREILTAAVKLPHSDEHRYIIDWAWESPTYTPKGVVRLGRSTER
jgi:hypothetical protein